MKHHLQIIGVGALALTLFAAPVFAQSAETRVLLDRITQMERQVQELSRKTYGSGGYVPGESTTVGGGVSSGNVSADMVTRLSALETQLRDMTGQIERANFQSQQANQNLEKLKADLELRLQQLEQGRANAAPATDQGTNDTIPAPAEEDHSDAADSAATPEELYNNAYAAMQKKEYITAEKGFREFLANNANHKLSPNAQYWLGESYFARGNYKSASAVFAESYQKYPKANKAPDSLLKLGLSLSEQKRTKDACTVLRQLTKEYPSASGSIATRTETEIKKLKCQ